MTDSYEGNQSVLTLPEHLTNIASDLEGFVRSLVRTGGSPTCLAASGHQVLEFQKKWAALADSLDEDPSANPSVNRQLLPAPTDCALIIGASFFGDEWNNRILHAIKRIRTSIDGKSRGKAIRYYVAALRLDLVMSFNLLGKAMLVASDFMIRKEKNIRPKALGKSSSVIQKEAKNQKEKTTHSHRKKTEYRSRLTELKAMRELYLRDCKPKKRLVNRAKHWLARDWFKIPHYGKPKWHETLSGDERIELFNLREYFIEKWPGKWSQKE